MTLFAIYYPNHKNLVILKQVPKISALVFSIYVGLESAMNESNNFCNGSCGFQCLWEL